jgi:Rieske Fe-S protein
LSTTTHDAEEGTRRDFLYVATGAVGAVTAGAAVWPLINQMNPSADVLALAELEVDISGLEEGMQLTVKWRGKPVFLRYRTPEEIEAARNTPLSDLTDTNARNGNEPSRRRRPTPTARSTRRASISSRSASAPISAACPSANPAIGAAGSAPATARITTPPAASERAGAREPSYPGTRL